MNEIKGCQQLKPNYGEILLKFETLEARLEKIENLTCKCPHNYIEAKQNAEIITNIENKQPKMPFEKVTFDQVTQTINQLQVLNTLYDNNNDEIDQLKGRMNKLEADIKKSYQSIKSCEAIFDVNSTYCSELDKQLIDLKENLDERDALLELNNGHLNTMNQLNMRPNEKAADIELIKIINNLSEAVNRHNNTLITHFELNKAYNVDIIEKINKNKIKMNKILKTTINDHEEANLNEEESRNEDLDSTAKKYYHTFKKISLRSLNYSSQFSKQFQISAYGTKMVDNELRKAISIMLESYKKDNINTDNLKWFVNKMTYENDNQHLKHIKYIVSLQEKINIKELNLFSDDFFRRVVNRVNTTYM